MDILLGCDVLGQAPMTWNHKQVTLVWGGTLHPIRYIAKRHGKVERVRVVSETIETFRPTLRVNTPIEIPSFQTELYPLTVSELPGTVLLVSPPSNFQSRVCLPRGRGKAAVCSLI